MSEELHPVRKATTEEMAHAFRLTARYSGNAARAARELGIRPDRLRHWRRKHADLYNKIAKQEVETVRQLEAEKHMEVAAEARDLESEVLVKVKAALEAGDIAPRDLANLSRNLATESGIHTDKAIALTRPDTIPGAGVNININMPEMVRAWAAKGSKFYDAEGNEIDPASIIEGTGEEVPDA